MPTERVKAAVGAEPREDTTCMGYTYSQIYFCVGGLALILHIINSIGIIAAYCHTLIHIGQRYVFVSPSVEEWSSIPNHVKPYYGLVSNHVKPYDKSNQTIHQITSNHTMV